MTRNCLLALGLGLLLVVVGCGDNTSPTDATSPDLASRSLNGTVRLNVLLKAPATAANRAELSKHGNIYDEIVQINAVLMRTRAEKVSVIAALPFVKAVSEDQPRNLPPLAVEPADAFVPLSPHNVWNLDAVNVTNWSAEGGSRQVTENGSGVFVAILDTGLVPFWPFYLTGKSVDTENAISSLGGGASGNGAVVDPPDKWETDVHGHGTHVSSIVLGFRYNAASTGGNFQVDGVAPAATLIPIKVLNQNGSGWTSGIAKGIVYATDLVLEGGPHEGARLVINLSLGGPVLDVVEQAALDYAVDHNVVVVASAGNSGPAGNLGFPGGYHRVIAVASAGWVGEWNDPPNAAFALPEPNVCAPLPIPSDALLATRFWRQCDVEEPYASSNFYISGFSSRDPDGLDTGPTYDLDVAAPGSWVVGPWAFNSGQINYAFVGGTSQASPHVAGIVALMLQKNDQLTPAQIETCLEQAAAALTDVNQRVIPLPGFAPGTPPNWGSDRSGHGFITADAALTAPGCFT